MGDSSGLSEAHEAQQASAEPVRVQPLDVRPEEARAVDARPRDAEPERRAASGVARALLLVAGGAATALAFVGAFLPILPTTPFLILATACFARSSPAVRRRLFENRVFGPYLAQWNREHTIPAAAKRKAYGLVAVSFAVSIALVDRTGLRIGLAVLGVLLVVFLAALPTGESRRAPRD